MAADGDDDLQRLRILGSAMAARPVVIAAAEPGAPAWTDGATIHLDPAADPDVQLRSLAVQASLLAAGSLEPDVLRRLGGRTRAARRYLAVEGRRALAANVAYLPRAVRPHVESAGPTWPGSPTASLEAAQGRDAVGDPPAWFGVLRPRQVLDLADRFAGAAGPAQGGVPAARALQDIDDEPADDDASADLDLGSLLSSPVGGGGPIGRLLKRLLSPSRRRGAGGSPGADAATHVTRLHRPGAGGSATGGAEATAADLADAAPAGYTYPEWDVHRGRYRPDWCTVVVSDPPPEELVPMAMPDGAALRRPLERLGTGLVPCRRRPQGDDIDLDAAVEAQVQLRAGSPVDEALYVERLRRRRDLSVQVLLDVSGSAGEPGPFGRPVHEHQRWAAAALVTALHDLGDRVALHAFNSHGRSSVRVARIKDFDDRLDARVALRLGGLVPSAYTRLGAAIRHGTRHLDEHGGTSRRLLVVLSDGFAYDHGYEGAYGEADARRALTEARRLGVGCLCLSIGAGTEAAALRRVFGTAAHASVPSPDRLPALVGPLFHASLLSAESRRRSHQRRLRTAERLDLEGRAR